MNPSDLGKPVILSAADGEVRGTLVGYSYSGKPTVDVLVGGRAVKYVALDQVRLVDEI
jgi:hypothetical protein